MPFPRGVTPLGKRLPFCRGSEKAGGEAASATFVSSLSRSPSFLIFAQELVVLRVQGGKKVARCPAMGNLPLPRASVALRKGARLDRGTEVGGGIGVCCLRLWPPQDGGDKEEANCVYDPGPKRLVR